MSELDDFFANIFEEAKPKAKEEPAKVEPVEEIVEPTYIVGESDTEEMESLEDKRRESFGNLAIGDEEVKEIEPPKPLSRIEQARAAVAEANQKELEARELIKQAKAEYEAMEEAMRAAREKFTRANADYNAIAMAKREAARKLSEEEHMANERAKEEALMAEKRVLVEGYRQKVLELDPAWRNGAYDHQWEGATTLALHGSALLGDEMGLGKSLTALMTLDFIEAHRTLIVAPSGTFENITLEAFRWAPHRFTFPIGGQDAATRNALMNTIFRRRFEQGKEFVMTLNFEALRNEEFVEQLQELQFDTIIVDEADGFKNKSGNLYKALYKLRYGYNTKDEDGNLANSVKHFYPMTGTFIRNKPQDIWPALNLVDNKSFPDEQSFLRAYCDYDYYEQKWRFRSGGVTSLIKRLGGRIVMRTTVECGITIPKQTIHDENPAHLEVCEECREDFPIVFEQDAYADQRKIMKQLAEHSQIILDADRKTPVMEQLAIITRNRQALVWPGGITLTGEYPDGEKFKFSVGEDVHESIVIDWCEQKALKKLSHGKRVVMFSQFKDGIKELERRFTERGIPVVRYDGDTPDDIKSRVMQDFDRRVVEQRNGEYEWEIVLCNFKTGGVGLNFTHATETILVDEYWNPAGNEQAFKRTARMGQTEETNVYIPRPVIRVGNHTKQTIAGWMKGLNDDKRDMIDGFNLEVDMEKNLNDFLSIMKGEL